jgi:predicted GNAT family acetyltransferase
MGQIKHKPDDKKGAFVYEVDGHILAQMVYVMAGPQKMIIDHTEVDDSLKGQQIGKKLLESLVHYVREKEIKVIPLCPFANAMLKKIKEWEDVVLGENGLWIK